MVRPVVAFKVKTPVVAFEWKTPVVWCCFGFFFFLGWGVVCGWKIPLDLDMVMGYMGIPEQKQLFMQSN